MDRKIKLTCCFRFYFSGIGRWKHQLSLGKLVEHALAIKLKDQAELLYQRGIYFKKKKAINGELVFLGSIF